MPNSDDIATLQAQYDVGAHYAGIEDYRARHAAAREAANKAARAQPYAELYIAYGTHPREKIDLFHAPRASAPLLIYIHGGYWRARDRSDFSFLAPAFVARGISLVSVGYPLCPEVRVRDIVESCRAAVRFIAGNAARLGVDAGRLHVSGHSAGGHLSAMMLATDWTPHGLPGDLLKTGIALSGLYDLAPVARTTINDEIHLDEAEIADLSAIRFAPRHAGALILSVGGRETDAFKGQMRDLGDAWAARGTRVIAVDNPDFYHFDLPDTLGKPGAPTFEAVVREIG